MSLRQGSLAVVGIVVLIGAGSAESSGADTAERALLERTMRDYRAAIGSIRTLHCRVKTVQMTPELGRAQVEIELYKNLDDFAAQIRYGEFVTNYIMKDGKSSTARMAGSFAMTAKLSGVIEPARQADEVPGWTVIAPPLIYAPGDRLMTLAEVMEREPDLVQSVKEVADGIQVEVHDAYSRRTVTFNRNYNSLITKVTSEAKDGSTVFVAEYKLREYIPTVYFVESGVQRTTFNGKLTDETPYSFSQVRINEPVPAGVFTVKFKPGTGVRDRIQDNVRIVLADGTLGGVHPDIQLESGPLPQAGVAPNASAPSAPIAVTQEEPKFWTRWIAPASAGILLLAGALWLIRRRASRAVQS